MIARRMAVENFPLSPRTPLFPVGRLTAYGKLAFGHLPTGLGKPLRGFPQPPSFDDDLSLLSMHISNCRYRTKRVDAGQEALSLIQHRPDAMRSTPVMSWREATSTLFR